VESAHLNATNIRQQIVECNVLLVEYGLEKVSQKPRSVSRANAMVTMFQSHCIRMNDTYS